METMWNEIFMKFLTNIDQTKQQENVSLILCVEKCFDNGDDITVKAALFETGCPDMKIGGVSAS